MVRRIVLACLLLGVAVHALAGCAASNATGPSATQASGPGEVTPETVNAMVLAFADDHVLRVIEAVDVLMARSPSLEERSRLNTVSLRNAQATFGIASSANPIVGMTDMVVMVSLNREAIRRSAIDRTLTEVERQQPESYDVEGARLEDLFGPEDRILFQALTESERELRMLAEQVFWPEQVAQLDELIEEWWARNPARRLVSKVRLQDFAGYRAATVETLPGGPRNLLGLLYLDPLASMDPTTREIAQSRMLAERITYQINRLPIIVSMHARGLLYESLTTDELVSVRTTLEGTEGTLARFADAVDRWPEEVATEREAAIEQLQESLAVERAAAIDQFAELVEVERQAVIADLEAAVSRQREELLLAIDERAEPLQETLSALDATLETANTLSGSVTETVRSIDDMDVSDFQQLVESTTDGVEGVERSLGTLERLLAPEAIGPATSDIDQSVTAATASTRELVDHVFWRAVQLAAIVLVGWVLAALCIKLLAARLSGRRPASSP